MNAFAEALFQFLLAASPALPTIIFPNVAGDTPAGEHLIVDILPGTAVAVGLNSLNEQPGVVQVTVMTPVGGGALNAYSIADQVVALFPRGTEIAGSRFDAPGSVAAPLPGDGAWFALPVTLPYTTVF